MTIISSIYNLLSSIIKFFEPQAQDELFWLDKIFGWLFK